MKHREKKITYRRCHTRTRDTVVESKSERRRTIFALSLTWNRTARAWVKEKKKRKKSDVAEPRYSRLSRSIALQFTIESRACFARPARCSFSPNRTFEIRCSYWLATLLFFLFFFSRFTLLFFVLLLFFHRLARLSQGARLFSSRLWILDNERANLRSLRLYVFWRSYV